MTLQVVVVGAGIVGAAISHQAARIGAKVRVLDAVTAPGYGGATRSTWAWINASKKHPQHYRDLNLAGLERWKAEWPELVHPCGSLVFDDDDAALSDPVYPARRLTPQQVRDAEPAIADGIASGGANLYAQEAWVDPQQACAEMLRQAERHGAQVLLGPGSRVARLVTQPTGPAVHGEAAGATADVAGAGAAGHRAATPCRVAGVVTEDGTTHPADVVVLAAGTSVQPLAAQAGVNVPLLHKPAVVAITQALQRGSTQEDRSQTHGSFHMTRHLLASAKVFAWQRPDGSFMLGDTRAHEDGSAAWGESLLQRATELLPGLGEAGAQVERVEVAYRPWPQDGHPIVGGTPSCPGLYVAVMHSGITLAPEVAALVAEELRHWDVERGCATGSAPELVAAQTKLAPYRLDRDFEAGAARAAYGWK